MNANRNARLQQIAVLLQNQGQSVSCAESCTGGLLAANFTALAGSSAWFNMSWVTYSNEAKMRLLGVNSATLQTFGAVSEETVREMASGAKVQAASDFAIGISGIAGPGGGTPNKPVGTVCFGLASVHGVQTWTAHFAGNRNEVREQAVDFALGKLLEILA